MLEKATDPWQLQIQRETSCSALSRIHPKCLIYQEVACCTPASMSAITPCKFTAMRSRIGCIVSRSPIHEGEVKRSAGGATAFPSPEEWRCSIHICCRTIRDGCWWKEGKYDHCPPVDVGYLVDCPVLKRKAGQNSLRKEFSGGNGVNSRVTESRSASIFHCDMFQLSATIRVINSLCRCRSAALLLSKDGRGGDTDTFLAVERIRSPHFAGVPHLKLTAKATQHGRRPSPASGGELTNLE